LRRWKAPGVAIAVVKDGKIVLERRYRFRDVKGAKPVTPTTLFAIGSATKSFTVATLGALALQGKVDWDGPVREYLPHFCLYDPVATEHMTPRDRVTHRSGLPRHDFVWYNAPLTREELYQRLRHLEPNKELRFKITGYLAGRIAGASWEEEVRKNLLDPLGMTGTNFSVTESQKEADCALPYELDDKDAIKEVRHAGGRRSDQLRRGRDDSLRPHVSEQRRLQRSPSPRRERRRRDGGAANGETECAPLSQVRYVQYGMSFITTYRGHKLVHHGGDIDGFSAFVSFMPQDDIGRVILTNLGGTPLPSVLSYNTCSVVSHAVSQHEHTARNSLTRYMPHSSCAFAGRRGCGIIILCASARRRQARQSVRNAHHVDTCDVVLPASPEAP
jgi:CubicO group peptidase (beta-lactamase class C family)